MAIDDNTSYELTGYQVKDLAGRIRRKADASAIPTVNDATLTLVQNGTTVGTFTANQSTNTTVNLAGGVYADDPTAPANPDGWITPSDIDWSTFTYSTSEQRVGTWVDGKPIYKKTVNFGTLPNASAKHVDHNITNLDHFVKAEGIAWTASKAAVSLPFASPNQLVGAISLLATSTGIDINTGNDRREFANCYVTLYYTKTTD